MKQGTSLLAPASEAVAHAWLTGQTTAPLIVHGAPPAVLRRTVEVLIQRMFCETAGTEPCGTCRSCRTVTAGTHPDVIIHTPTRATIPIKEVRQLIAQGGQTAWGQVRVIALMEAERLSLPAAQAFLKTLEESPIATRYLLALQWRRRLLPTILSRSQSVRVVGTVEKMSSEATTESEIPSSLLARLAQQSKEPLSDEALEAVTDRLITQVRTAGANPAVRSALQRLRDYYVVRSRRGNERLARDLLLSSLPSGLRY